MNNRTLGEMMSLAGAPASTAAAYLIDSIYSEKLGQLLWSAPLMLAMLPLLPVALKAESILHECDLEDFRQKTINLPRIWLTGSHCYIEVDDHGEFLVQPFYYQDDVDSFETLHDARSWLIKLGYEEVVSLDYPDSLQTYWIQKEKE